MSLSPGAAHATGHASTRKRKRPHGSERYSTNAVATKNERVARLEGVRRGYQVYFLRLLARVVAPSPVALDAAEDARSHTNHPLEGHRDRCAHPRSHPHPLLEGVSSSTHLPASHTTT